MAKEEYIERHSLMRKVHTGMNIIEAMQAIVDEPTVNAVPVVRCLDCKWWRGPIYGNRCSYHSGPNHTEFYDADEFCSRGERKGGGE